MFSNQQLTTTQILPPDAFVDDGETFGADLLLFDGKHGEWTNARDKAEIPTGTKAVALVDQILKGFTRFDDGMPRSRLLPLWPTPDLQALRQSLGDLDQELWPERNSKGEPQDPWRPARQLPVILLETGEGLVFSTSSFGGVKAVSLLGRAVAAARRDPGRATALPIVSLAVDEYPHKNKSFGMIYVPMLDIDGWTTLGEVEAAHRDGDFTELAVDNGLEDEGDEDDEDEDDEPKHRKGVKRPVKSKKR